MKKWFDKIKREGKKEEAEQAKKGWIGQLKETEGRKGLLPWLSVKIQKWILIGVTCFGAIATLICFATGEYLYLVWTILGILALYAGIKTKWLKDVEEAPKVAKIGGAVAVGVGTLSAFVSFLYVAFIVFVMVLVLAVLFIALLLYFGEAGSRGKIRGEVGEVLGETKTIRKQFFGKDSNLYDESGMKIGKITKAWFSHDQIIRDKDGKEIGSIKQSIWNKDVQDVFDDSGNKVGEIRTNVWGQREIVDSSGSTVGTIGKDLWGETTIRK